MGEENAEDGFFDGSDAGEDSLIWQVEQLVRGGEEGRDQAIRRLKESSDKIRKKRADRDDSSAL